jgi:HAE1 family hydrophobic/amphiphilic exporter-1
MALAVAVVLSSIPLYNLVPQEYIPSNVDADTTLKLDRPELRVVIDRKRAADLNVDTEHIATAFRLMVGGDTEVSRFHDPTVNEEYDVQLRLSRRDRDNIATISRLYVPRPGAGLVRLDNLVEFESVESASRIDRLNRQRQVSLRAQIAPGFALADRLEALNQAVREMNLPAGYTTSVSGRGRELARTFNEFLWAFLLSIIFMYMILAAQYESTVHPFTILLSLPLSVPFALLSLWLTGNTLNLYSALGILVLFGVVKKNSILQIDHMNKLREAGMERMAAVLQANRDRLRPILMTHRPGQSTAEDFPRRARPIVGRELVNMTMQQLGKRVNITRLTGSGEAPLL